MAGKMDRLSRLLMAIGQHAFVRFDPERSENKFTVVVNNERLGDTNAPCELLEKYLRPSRTCCGTPVQYLCECGQNWVCPVCGNGTMNVPCLCEQEGARYQRSK